MVIRIPHDGRATMLGIFTTTDLWCGGGRGPGTGVGAGVTVQYGYPNGRGRGSPGKSDGDGRGIPYSSELNHTTE